MGIIYRNTGSIIHLQVQKRLKDRFITKVHPSKVTLHKNGEPRTCCIAGNQLSRLKSILPVCLHFFHALGWCLLLPDRWSALKVCFVSCLILVFFFFFMQFVLLTVEGRDWGDLVSFRDLLKPFWVVYPPASGV